MAVTLTKIAKEAKVSVSLVSRFFNNDPTLQISDEKARLIEQVRDRLGGVKPRQATRSRLRSLANNFVMPLNHAFSLDWFSRNYCSSQLFRSMQAVLKDNGFRLSASLIDPDERLEFAEEMVTSCGYCDGMLLGSSMLDESLASYLLAKGFPHVSIDPRAEQYGVNTVSDYGISGLRAAVSHLLELGHRRIGYVGTNYRFADFIAAMTEKEVPFRVEDKCDVPHLRVGDIDRMWRGKTHDAFAAMFNEDDGPTAVFCANDYMALGVMDVLRERGLEPGVDLSVIGYDNIEQRSNDVVEQPVLTTVDVPYDVIGQRCAEILLDQAVNGRTNIVHEHIPLKLIVRGTTGVCPRTV